MLEDKEASKPTEEFITLPGNVVKTTENGEGYQISLETIKELELPTKQRGEIVKKKIKDALESGMRQDEFNREMTKIKQERDEIEQLKEILASTEGKTDLGEAGQTPSKESTDELSELTIREDEIMGDNPEVTKKMINFQNVQARYIKNLEKKLKEKEAQEDEMTKKRAKEAESQKLFVESMQPAIKKHRWLIKDDPAFDEDKCASFTERLRIDTDKSPLEIADMIEERYKNRTQKDIDGYLKEKEDQQKKSSFQPSSVGQLPSDVKLESKTHSDAIYEAAEKFKVNP